MLHPDVRAGARSVLPLAPGIVPFGLVAGATPVAQELGAGVAMGLSTIVFAGASQLAAAEVLGGGGTAVVAAVAACTINLRMLLYSASLAPHLAAEPLRRRLLVAYLLTDQSFAVSIARWQGGAEPPGRRVPYYLGAGGLLWIVWVAMTAVGALVGASVPAWLPLGFAVPLVFLVLLVPALASRPAVVAAAVGATCAVGAAELGAGSLSILAGAVGGIAAGAVADAALERRAAA